MPAATANTASCAKGYRLHRLPPKQRRYHLSTFTVIPPVTLTCNMIFRLSEITLSTPPSLQVITSRISTSPFGRTTHYQPILFSQIPRYFSDLDTPLMQSEPWPELSDWELNSWALLTVPEIGTSMGNQSLSSQSQTQTQTQTQTFSQPTDFYTTSLASSTFHQSDFDNILNASSNASTSRSSFHPPSTSTSASASTILLDHPRPNPQHHLPPPRLRAPKSTNARSTPLLRGGTGRSG